MRVKRVFCCLLLALTVFGSPSLGSSLPKNVITIQKVELKSASGEWVTVIEPDRQVDLLTTIPRVSFINNGRVPPGGYTNFRLTLSEIPKDRIEICSAKELEDPLEVRKGSFVSVSFSMDREGTLDEVEVIVDQRELKIPSVGLHLRSPRRAS
ncbi:MAG: DUF4382 domain-containing protein [Candidatus Omnitrophica bacterium]|nr:DUF4382 domain-containing protein [Candidatus Omnitrophota bacterium]